MKKATFILILAFSALADVNAQRTDRTTMSDNSDPRQRLAFGVKAGMNNSNIYDTKGGGFHANPKTGFAGGIFLSIPIGAFLGFQPEAMYSMKGFKATGKIFENNFTLTRSATYIDFPLQLQVKPSKYFTILGGPQYSYLLTHQDIYENNTTISTQQQQDIQNANLRKNILGLIFGLDINFRQIILSGRVSWDLQNNNIDGSPASQRYRNTLWQATVGNKF